MSTTGEHQPQDRYDWSEDPTAQDIIDAMRIVVVAQDDSAKALRLVEELLDWAPETASNRGIDLLLRMITEATIKVELVDRG